MKEKEKEQLQKQAQEELFKAQKKFQEEKRIYNEAIHNYYKTLKNISAKYPTGDYFLKERIEELLKTYNIGNFELEKYDNSKIFDYIISNIDSLYNIFESKKETIKLLNPDNIDKLSIILSASKNDYLFKKIIENNKETDFIHPIVKPIIEDTYGAIVFKEQAEEIVNLILDTTEYEIDMFYTSFSKLYRLKGDIDKIDDSISIIDYIEKNYPDIYVEQYKALYFGFIASAIEKGLKEDEANKLFNLLLAYFAGWTKFKNEIIFEAKQLYKLAFIELNYQNKSVNKGK